MFSQIFRGPTIRVVDDVVAKRQLAEDDKDRAVEMAAKLKASQQARLKDAKSKAPKKEKDNEKNKYSRSSRRVSGSNIGDPHKSSSKLSFVAQSSDADVPAPPAAIEPSRKRPVDVQAAAAKRHKSDTRFGFVVAVKDHSWSYHSLVRVNPLFAIG